MHIGSSIGLWGGGGGGGGVNVFIFDCCTKRYEVHVVL